MNLKHNSFTLTELLLVVIIIGLLAAFAVPSFRQAQLRAIDREARANLKLIQTAQEVAMLEENSYQACADNDDCNSALNLDLPLGGNWNYRVFLFNGNFRAVASGTRGTTNWQIESGDDEAVPEKKSS